MTTNFQKKVYKIVCKIPKGQTMTYKQIASVIGSKAYQAVGQALKINPDKIRITGKTIIGYHKLGYVLTSAGVDRIDNNTIALIPRDPDDSARKIRQRLEKKTKKKLAVIITDSEGREDRLGAGAVALGVSGIKPVVSIQLPDGKVTEETISDMLANSASLIMGQRGKNKPIVIVRGYNFERDENARMQDYLTFK